jgi:SAM-dependent methyltransferase
MTTTERPIEECVVEVLGHLGIERAHFAAGGAPTLTDWHGLAIRHPERIASLTVVSPPILDGGELAAIASRLLVVAGDQADTGQGAVRLATDLPDVSLHSMRGYEAQPWADVAADRGEELTAAMFAFLGRHAAAPIALSEAAGEAAGISYRIRGAGPPLVLTPLMLAPSQWEPVLPTLAAKYCTISLGGPRLGVVSTLEARGRSAYLTVVRNVLDVVAIRPGETVLEVGGGSGVVLREIARRTGGASRIIDVDVNPYLLREAGALTEQAGFAGCIEFHQGSAEAIPLADRSVDVALSFTVLEEGDADRMLTELVRVTRPGGRVAAIVRAVDMPAWVSVPLSADILAKAEQQRGMANGGVAADAGCGDRSLYRRMRAAGLTGLTCFPQFAVLSPEEAARLTIAKQRILASLTAAEAREWQDAAARAEADGTFFIAAAYHCAVGAKST